MKNKDLQISDKINAHRIGDYDPEAGWAQLEKRLYPRKKRTLNWRYAAAACLIAGVAGAFLYRNHSAKTAGNTGLAGVRLMDKTLPIVINDRIIRLPALPGKTIIQQLLQRHAPVAARSFARAQPVVETPAPLPAELTPGNAGPYPHDPLPEIAAVKPAAPVDKSSAQLPVLAEEAFEAVVNLEAPRRKKENRFLKYLAARARQTDYTGEKLSSSTTIVKF
ncbi:MAG: hypothetical protein J7599_22590 [Niabella sp.]|nr:hypothetical protein [Niabella sp.]